MKKLITLILGIALVYSCSSSSDGNGNSTVLNMPGPNVTDIDGNVYHTITNCSQTWTKTNLNVSKYRNGDVIPQVTNTTQWATLNTGAWCYYNNDPANGLKYGKLYNWYAVNDPRGLAPSGFHIPTDLEWSILTNCLGGETVAGGALKETGTTNWTSPNTGATNSSGFTGLPGGFRNNYGTFLVIGRNNVFWSSSEGSAPGVWYRDLGYNYSYTRRGATFKMNGFSVRCLRD